NRIKRVPRAAEMRNGERREQRARSAENAASVGGVNPTGNDLARCPEGDAGSGRTPEPTPPQQSSVMPNRWSTRLAGGVGRVRRGNGRRNCCGPGLAGGEGPPAVRSSAGQLAAAPPALTRPAPKKLLLPIPPEQNCTGAPKNSTPGSRTPGQGIPVAVCRSSATTDPTGMSGCVARIRATTPTACGAAIDVPLSHAQ